MVWPKKATPPPFSFYGFRQILPLLQLHPLTLQLRMGEYKDLNNKHIEEFSKSLIWICVEELTAVT